VTEPPEKVKFNMNLTITPKAGHRDITAFHAELEDALKNSTTFE
jgi:hypothetical protein